MPGLTFFFLVLEYTTNRRATPGHQVVSCQSPPQHLQNPTHFAVGYNGLLFEPVHRPVVRRSADSYRRDTRCKGEKFLP